MAIIILKLNTLNCLMQSNFEIVLQLSEYDLCRLLTNLIALF